MRRSPLYEVVGQLGMWGTIINGVQAAIIEHKKMKEVTWSSRNSLSLFTPVVIEFAALTTRFFLKQQSGSCLVTRLVRVPWLCG